MRFRTVIELGGKTATGFRVPPHVLEQLGTGKKPKVRVTIGPHTYRSTVAVYGGVFMLPLSAENRTAAGVSAGDEVDVDIELDTEPRTVDVPPDLAARLDEHPARRAAFEALSYSRQRAHVLAVEGAKTVSTRQRRIERVIQSLPDL